jgi:hypothetical protein
MPDAEESGWPLAWINRPPIVETDLNGFVALYQQSWGAWCVWESKNGSFARVWPSPVQGQRFFVYMLGGLAVGAMVIDKVCDHTRIDVLATHPGTRGCGSILIEHAVNLSEEAGFGGRVELNPGNRWRDSFLAKGFVGPVAMKLDPGENPEKWVKVDNEWRLRKHRVRSPLDLHTWRDVTIEAQIGRRFPPRNFGFLS